MRKVVFLLAIFLLNMAVSFSTFAQNRPSANDVRVQAADQFTGEMMECVAYFTVAAQCLAGNPDPTVSQQIANLKRNANEIGALAVTAGTPIGLNEDDFGALIVMARRDIAASMNESCANISVPADRYADFCKLMLTRATLRLQELLQGKKCNGSYRCQ